MTLLAGEPARMLALAAALETLGAELHRAAPPPPGRAVGLDPWVADAHSAAARSATVAIGRLADHLLTDADLLYLVTARYDRADDQAAAALDRVRSAQPATSELYPQLRSCGLPESTCPEADASSRFTAVPEAASPAAGPAGPTGTKNAP